MKTLFMGTVAALAAAVVSSAAAQPLPMDKRIVLVVDEWKAVRNLPVVVAERLGYLKSDGMDVTVVNVRDDVWHGDLLMDGRADAVMAYWHHNIVNHSIGRDTQAVASVFADLTTLEGTTKAFGVPFPSSTVFMATARIKERPDVARHLARVFVQALRYINTHSADQIAAIVPDEVKGKDHDKYMKALKEALPMFATDGRMPADGAAFEFRTLAEFDPKFKSVDVQRTYTNAFIEEALKGLP